MENRRIRGVGCNKTLMVVDVGLKGVSKADTATNLVSVAILLFWILASIATNCLTFKNKKDEKD